MEVQDPGSQPPGDLAEIPGSEGEACLCRPCLEGLSELGGPQGENWLLKLATFPQGGQNLAEPPESLPPSRLPPCCGTAHVKKS